MIWISILGLLGYICEIHLKPLNLEFIELASIALLNLTDCKSINFLSRTYSKKYLKELILTINTTIKFRKIFFFP